MMFDLTEKDILRAEIFEGPDGEWGLYIVPGNSEICITEEELRRALTEIKTRKEGGSPIRQGW